MNPLPSRLFVASTCLLLSATAMVGAPADPAVTPASGATATSSQTVASRPATAPKASDHFERTKARIDALLKYRLKPEPLPANPPNPFQLSGAATLTTSQGDDATASDPQTPMDLLPPGSDAESLALYAAMLKISGTVLLNGRVHLIINQSPYKEGDLILLKNKDAVIYLQVMRIAPDELTLGLNEAVQTIKYKVN